MYTRELKTTAHFDEINVLSLIWDFLQPKWIEMYRNGGLKLLTDGEQALSNQFLYWADSVSKHFALPLVRRSYAFVFLICTRVSTELTSHHHL